MARTWFLAILVGATVVSSSSAQTSGWRFRWQTGQVLTYRTEHTTKVAEVVSGSKMETSSRLTVTKSWEVQNVDDKGVATLRMSLKAMRSEQTRPNGDTLLFDSADLEKSTPELREQMMKYIGQTLAVLRVDGQGRVVEVKQGDAGRYESDPPFVVILPAPVPQVGQMWERTYQITLDPPQGTGEKYQATQRYKCLKNNNNQATIGLTTQFKTLPESLLDRVPLLQKQPEGEIVFDVETGRLLSLRLTIDKDLQGHQGEGSRYLFQSVYTEQLVTNE